MNIPTELPLQINHKQKESNKKNPLPSHAYYEI